MCLWFACFGLHKHNDDCYAPPPPAAGVPTKPPPHDGRPPQAPPRNGYAYAQPQGAHYGNGYGHYQTAAGADEAGRKASNDARRGPAAAKYTPEKPVAYTGAAETVLQPAWNGKIAEGAAHGAHHHHHNYYHEREPAHKDAAMDCRHQYTAAATSDHGRY